MATFYSPSGNPEVWTEKPEGYMTPEEWQTAHPAPEPTPPTAEELAKQRRQEILMELDRIDRASSRSLRAILTAQAAGQEPDKADVEILAEHEADAKALRAEMAALNA